jgi:AAA family ATP:ADP antiporter
MSYIPLDPEMRGNAKAAVDVVGARFGKSGASALFILLNAVPAFNNNSLNYVHTILGLFALSVGAWMFSTISLGRQFDTMNKESEEEKKDVSMEKGEKN